MGISQRYLVDFLGWKDLLKAIAERMRIPEKTYIAYVAEAEDDIDGDPPMPCVASKLKKELLKGIKKEKIDPEEIFDKEEYNQYISSVDPIKILAASFCINESLKSDEGTSKEMESFKKLGHVVPCIITTNYDQFLEKYIFTRFKVYSKVSDYYYSDSEGIGEIYKIHGTASKPDTMILTHKDYKNFRKNSKIVTSKILSALCDYPMLILGYSMEDDDVKGIINDLISSLDEDKLQQVERNIIYVDYVEGQKDVIYKNRIFSYDNKTMSVSSIETDDFKKIFDEIADDSFNVSACYKENPQNGQRDCFI